MEKMEKIVKAQKAEERAEETLIMKRLYAAFLEGGMEIDEAVELLRNDKKKTEEMKEMNARNGACVGDVSIIARHSEERERQKSE